MPGSRVDDSKVAEGPQSVLLSCQLVVPLAERSSRQQSGGTPPLFFDHVLSPVSHRFPQPTAVTFLQTRSTGSRDRVLQLVGPKAYSQFLR